MNDHNTFCESDPTCRGASEQCVTCEASFNAGFLAGQASRKKKDAEKCRAEKCGANAGDDAADRYYDLACECCAKAIEGGGE